MKDHELVYSYKVPNDSLRERTRSLNFSDQSSLQSSTNLQRRTPVIQHPTSIVNNLPLGYMPSFPANNHLIMMYQNLFPQQLAAHFRRLAENALQDIRDKASLYHFSVEITDNFSHLFQICILKLQYHQLSKAMSDMKIHAQMLFMLRKYSQRSPCLDIPARGNLHRRISFIIKLLLTMIPQEKDLDRGNRQRLIQRMNRLLILLTISNFRFIQ